MKSRYKHWCKYSHASRHYSIQSLTSLEGETQLHLICKSRLRRGRLCNRHILHCHIPRRRAEMVGQHRQFYDSLWTRNTVESFAGKWNLWTCKVVKING
jgi:hypothetical protein